MAFIKGYKYNTEGEAQAVINQINEHFGLPLPNCVTQNYTTYRQINSFFVIEYLPEISFIGDPVEIEIIRQK